ncbi:MAG: MarR family transcriptional regulator [Ketobacter sp.]|nr:MAG: MarR family transcriptional regulator [Ketobacter sp.]
MNKSAKDTVDHFIEQMGMITQSEGMPRISGQILGLLLIETGPFSFSEIAERLEVSRGSVSTNTRLLENLGVIERIAKMGDRCDYFQLANDPYVKLLHGASQRMEKSITVVREAITDFPQDWKQSQTRLQDLEHFYTEYLKITTTLSQRLKTD